VGNAAVRDIILYELNEVPWEIVDHYVAAKPGSNLAGLLPRARCQTTVNEDQHHHLDPWRTWSTFHKALYADDHNSLDLGQDPATFQGKTIWDAAEEAGLSIGVFGALQSWPAREPQHGAFFIPDTFSRDPEVYPRSLRRFQEFNLFMTRQQGFSSNAPLNLPKMALAGGDMVLRGFTPASMRRTMAQLVRERRDERYKAARPIIQALPSFDLYWRLHRRTRPNLSIYFTNHVAGMLHRYWGDAIPGYAEEFDYTPDDVFSGLIEEAMDVFDAHLGRIVGWLRRNPGSVLMVGSSMGQAGARSYEVGETYVLSDFDRFRHALDLPPFEPGLAMFPRYTFKFENAEVAERAARTIASVTDDGEPMFSDVRADGATVSCGIRLLGAGDRPLGEVSYEADGSATRSGIGALGIDLERRLGGGNTAYHTPEGILITYGQDISPDRSRADISVLEVAPAILEMLGLEGSLVGKDALRSAPPAPIAAVPSRDG
jgi:hypothetical protein